MLSRFSAVACIVCALALSVYAPPANSITVSKIDYPAGGRPQSVFAADLDGDNDVDLAVTSIDTNDPDSVLILLNNGNGTFAAPVMYHVRGGPYSVFAADLDNDGDNDLAVACVSKGAAGPDSVSILLNNGNGTFASMVNYQAGSDAQCVFAADFDGDTALDLATANRYSGDVSILFNNGNGTFAAPVNYTDPYEPYALCAADLDGDNDVDLAVTDNRDTVFIFLNNGSGTFQNTGRYGVGDHPWGIFSADLDDDNDNDLAVANQNSDNVSILLNYGNGTFAAAVNYGAGDAPMSVYGADLEGGDGDFDLAAANFSSDSVSILFNNGNGTFAAAVNFPVGDGPTSVYAADLNGDTTVDLVTANYFSDNVSVLLIDCCRGIRGNANGDAGDQTNVADVTYLVVYLFQSGPPPPCFDEGNVNGSGGINVGDLTYLVEYLFQGGPPPPACP
jgi:hypothetical protein